MYQHMRHSYTVEDAGTNPIEADPRDVAQMRV